jgi:predicted CoA-binding protein
VILDDEKEIGAAVRDLSTIAVLGVKDQEGEVAHDIPAMLARLGARIGDLTEKVDCLDVFRRIEAIPGHVDEILALPSELRPRGVWLQSGIFHDQAAQRLADAGIWVVQDRCLGVYARRYGVGKGTRPA